MIVIKTHSIVDIITNSSTTIFTWASGNAEAMVLELIDEVLAVAGSDKKAKDLYDVEVQVSDIDEIVGQIIRNGEDSELIKLKREADAVRGLYGYGNEYYAASDKLEPYVLDNYTQEQLMKYTNYDGWAYDTEIVVTRKDGKKTGIDKILGSLFHSDGYRDG